MTSACDSNGNVVIRLDGDELYFCNQSGEILNAKSKNGNSVEITCPNKAEFCKNFSARCSLDCNKNGICLEGNRCFCFNGFSGDDCVYFI